MPQTNRKIEEELRAKNLADFWEFREAV